MKVLSNEAEGIVRLEAVALIRFLYLSQCFEEDEIPQIFEIMTTAATMDLHWEVKINALQFWDKIIWEHLTEQGMIDKNFPEVTFSKECRKIITLNDDEIKKRLNKVLNELNKIGCLNILTKIIQEDSDFEVVEKAIVITKNLVELLKKHKVISCLETKSICQNRIRHEDFFDLIRHDLDRIVENRKKWVVKQNHFEILLDDMLRDIEDDEDMNTMDCY